MANYPIMIALLAVFIGAGVLLPLINQEYGIEDADDYDAVTIGQLQDTSVLTVPSIAWSVLSMFFWTFGALPIWLDAMFLVLRLTFWVMLVDVVLP